MIKNTFLLDNVRAKYQQINAKSEEKKFMQEQALLANDAYSELVYKIKAKKINLQRATFLADSKSILSISEELTALETKRNELLHELAYHKFEPVYECSKCHDTGILPNGNYCHCFYERLTDEAISFCEIRKPRLNSFEEDTLSTKQNLSVTYEKMRKYATSFSENSKSIIFAGQSGTGKTFLTSAMVNEISKKNFNVIFLTANELNQVLLKYQLSNTFDKQVFFDILTTCDLLVIDDLGAEPILKGITLEYLFSIISERLASIKPFIITTNLSPDKMFERYGERLYSRFKNKNAIILQFEGKDVR